MRKNTHYLRILLISAILSNAIGAIGLAWFWASQSPILIRERRFTPSPLVVRDVPTDWTENNTNADVTESHNSKNWKKWKNINLDRVSTKESLNKSESMKWWINASHSQLQHSCVNKHNYKFLINNESLCKGDVYLVIYIHSDPELAVQRNLIRRTWGSLTSISGCIIVHVFLIGSRVFNDSEKTRELQEHLEKENLLYHDIIQGDFNDSYLNLTYKNIMGLHWANTFCHQASFLLKTDDDVVVDIYGVIEFLRHNEDVLKRKTAMFCHSVRHRDTPDREPRHKWCVSEKEYPFKAYATYCNGLANIITQSAVRALYAASSKVPFFWMDDVYTGFCAEASNTQLVQVGRRLPDWRRTVFIAMDKHSKQAIVQWYASWKRIYDRNDRSLPNRKRNVTQDSSNMKGNQINIP